MASVAKIESELLQGSIDGVFAFDLKCHLIYWNPAMESIGQPLVVLQLRREGLGCRSRAAGHEDREQQQCGHPWWRHRSVPRLTLTLS